MEQTEYRLSLGDVLAVGAISKEILYAVKSGELRKRCEKLIEARKNATK